jgi:hypothetical protein
MMDEANLALDVNVVPDLAKLAAKRMRMLRLGEGWSAETLSQKYQESGAGILKRTTIAKIESANREIKAAEVEGVARVFGLTSADLLHSTGPTVFVSYAEQDGSIGQEVAAWLGDHGFQVLSAPPPAADQPGPGAGEWHVIDTALAFVALLSPSFLSSSRCREELDLAARRRLQLLSAGVVTDFIYVLGIAEAPDLDNSGLESYLLIKLVQDSDRSREAALSKLGGRIISNAPPTATQAGPVTHVQSRQAFLDRGEELERVFYSLSNPAGPHFWLVISPPELGKSTFLAQLADKAESAAAGWVTSTVDLRRDSAGRQDDALMVVRQLFGFEGSRSSGPEDDLRSAALKIIRTGQPWLCLLDSAELLTASAVAQLRLHLSEIHRLIQESRSVSARLAFVVASRRDDGWRGLTPSPRLSVLRMGGFGPSAVQDALEGLALRMPGVRSPAELRQDAALVHDVTEGVPVLVQASLQWIQAEEWLEIRRLDNPQHFAKIIAPYIEDHLLAPDSLLPGVEGPPEKSAQRRLAVRNALRALVPYRFFTLSHVQHHLDNNPSFKDDLEDAHWDIDELWRAIVNMALLYRPLDEAWHEIHPAVRRLLYRHFYTTDEGANAHLRARDFTTEWAGQLTGTDQMIGVVESIWHEAARLRLSSGTETMRSELVGFARMRSLAVNPSHSSPYTEAELRNYAADRMLNDDELQREVAAVQGLFEEIIQVVRVPEAREA